ncbi:TRM11 family SAM-dependent methyltransferase [Bacteroidota bacterium]
MTYAILQHPGHNRVYYKASVKLALAELMLASGRMNTDCSDIKELDIEGIKYLSLETDGTLSKHDLDILCRLSFQFALYQYKKSDSSYTLYPIKKEAYEYIDPKISSLLKYQGKTNELFTKMMINVALLSSEYAYSDRIRLLDPVAGKGTTLYEAAVYGFDALGVEIDLKLVHDANVFFKKFLEAERFKHHTDNRRVGGSNKTDAVYMEEFAFAPGKEEFKEEENRRKLGIVCGNTMDLQRYFKKESFHLIVGDLPYGIAHSSTAKHQSNTRNPSQLLEASLDNWKMVLRKGGTVVLAWNTFLVSRKELSEIFSKKGFFVFTDYPYTEFEHRVDKSIKRDIIVAKKV